MRWLRKKYPKTGVRKLLARHFRCHSIRRRRVPRGGNTELFLLDVIRVKRYRLAWLRPPDYTMASGEPDA